MSLDGVMEKKEEGKYQEEEKNLEVPKAYGVLMAMRMFQRIRDGKKGQTHSCVCSCFLNCYRILPRER